MKKFTVFLIAALTVISVFSQQKNESPKKYQGLLWEIMGKGLSKPSYLFGTMHVSNKLAFHLSDSFYSAIKSVEVVALETNPANWQDDYSKSSAFNSQTGSVLQSYFQSPNDFIRKNTFAIKKYERNVMQAMATEPSMINGMLYRTYTQAADFEEDTYLDMYIFQTGSKLGKKLTGVENFEESEKLVSEAYKDAAKEQINKGYESDYLDDENNKPLNIEDAYRNGDLDLLDSLEMKQFKSKAFLEKFLYKRNEIQAKNIDSILKSKTSLFVGVGSAHLPGKRGVIEMLRKMGYILRPVKMGARDGQQKDAIDKIRVPVKFNIVNAEDGIYAVAIPGEKFYSFSRMANLDTKQFADMSNGAYYVVSRIKTNSLLLGDNTNAVYKKVDSLLYENIPGKIIKKLPITKNGFNGFDITNRTRRGDMQRYNIFITPFEILLFKMSGIGDYVKEGTEANSFFNSITIKNLQTNNWKFFQPSTGGFQIALPHTPLLQKDFATNRLEYTAYDENENATYSLIKANIQNYNFIEEDTFDLNLMEESYASGEMIDKQLKKQLSKWQGYPTLESSYKHKDGSYSKVRFLLQGPNYFAQVVHFKTESKKVNQYLESFKIVPFIYPEVKLRVDTAMRFTVQTPLFPDEKKHNDFKKILQNYTENYAKGDDDNIQSFDIKMFGNDTIGEKIFVVYAKMPKNTYLKDSSEIFRTGSFGGSVNDKTQSYLYMIKDSGITKNGMHYKFNHIADTNSSRIIISKSFYKLGNYFAVVALTDTLTPQSALMYNFIATFTPADTVSGVSPFLKQNATFFKNYSSKDSATHAKANMLLSIIEFDLEDVPKLKNIIDTLSWNTKDYLQTKQNFIGRLSETKDTNLVSYLKQLYFAAKDTADLQNTILKELLLLRTSNAITAFKDLIIEEPPVVVANNIDYNSDLVYNVGRLASKFNNTQADYNSNYNQSWFTLYDSLSLGRIVFPDLLQLINLDDYEGKVMELLTTMVDSGYVKGEEYESYFPKFFSEAKQELKKERARESQLAIAKAEKANKTTVEDYDKINTKQIEIGNELLQSYAVLLLPYWEKNAGVQMYFNDLMKLKNKQIRFEAMMLLLRNNKTISDTLLNFYGSQDVYRASLYGALKKVKLLNKFPAKYNNQSMLVRSAIVSFSNNENYDTLVLLDKLPTSYKDKKGVVYFYKYKNRKEEKKWRILSFGLQPTNNNEYDDDNNVFTSIKTYSYDRSNNNTLDEAKPVKPQLVELLKTMQYKMHKSATQFYAENYYDYDEVSENIQLNGYCK